jgi:hypothetical protein
MAKKNLLTNSAIASYTPDGSEKIELHTNLQVITDSRGPRVVVHEFPYRDGAKVETLGRKPHKTSWRLTFTGADMRDTLLALAQGLESSSSGLLVHPIYGQMRVVCHGFDRSVIDIPNATDTVTLELAFTEDQLDLGIVEQQGLAAKQQAASSAVAEFKQVLEPYKDQDTVSTGQSLMSTASSYASAAYAAASTVTIDPSLDSQLASVGTALVSFQSAVAVDSLAARSVAQSYDVLIAAELVYAACLDLADEIALETTGFQVHTVMGMTSIAVLAASLYGAQAIKKIDQILQLNNLPDPTAIPAGTVLILPP